jgi:transposase
LTKVRRSAVRRIAKGRHAGRALAPKAARHALARARDDLEADTTDRGARQRAAVAEVCALDADLAVAYQLKEAFRATMAIGRVGDAELFAVCLAIFDTWCRASRLSAFITLANSLRSWRAEIINYARTGGASNAFAEALNHLIKNQKRQAHGYATWQGFRCQILWAFGEVIDPDTGEILPLRLVPRGQGTTHQQP